MPLRPLGLGEVLDGAVGILRRYPRPALGLAAIVALFSALANLLITATAFRGLFELDQTALEAGDSAQLESALGGFAAGGLLAGLVGLLSSAIMTGALTALVGKAVLGQPFTFTEAWRQVLPRILPLIGVSLLIVLACGGIALVSTVVGAVIIALVGGWGVLVGLPLIFTGFAAALFLYVRLALAPCALVLERAGVVPSLKRSFLLVKHDWWRIFGILLLTLVIGGFVSNILQIPFALFGAGGLSNLFDAGEQSLSGLSLGLTAIGATLAGTLVAPFTAGVRALLYVDRRIRAEGLDVSLAAAAAQSAGPDGVIR